MIGFNRTLSRMKEKKTAKCANCMLDDYQKQITDILPFLNRKRSHFNHLIEAYCLLAKMMIKVI